MPTSTNHASRRAGLTALIATIFLTVGPLRPGIGSCDEARDAYNTGIDLYDEQRFEEAAESFRKAYELKPSWKLLYNIAQSDAAAARYGLALEAFEAYMVQGADDVPEDRRDDVLAEIQRLRVLVGVIAVRAEDGVELYVDEISRGSTPFSGPVRVAAGKHTVQLRRGGAVLLDKEVSVAGGMTSVVEAPRDEPVSVTADVEKEPTTEPRSEEDGPGRVWTWVALGVGAAAGIGGGVVGGLSMSRENDLADQCVDKSCAASLEEEADSIRTMNLTADVLYGVAAAGIITGVVLFFVEPGLAGDEGNVALVPVPAADGFGPNVQGRF